MKLTYLLVDINVIPDGLFIKDWIKNNPLMVKDITKVKEVSFDTTFWRWIKYKLGIPLSHKEYQTTL